MLISAGYALKLDILLMPLDTHPTTRPLRTLALFQILGKLELQGPHAQSTHSTSGPVT